MNRVVRIALLLLIGVGASTLISWSVYSYVLRPAQAREEAFAAIRSGELAVGPDGVVVLPSRWAMGSLDGKAPAFSIMRNLVLVSSLSLIVGYVVFERLKKRFYDYL